MIRRRTYADTNRAYLSLWRQVYSFEESGCKGIVLCVFLQMSLALQLGAFDDTIDSPLRVTRSRPHRDREE